MLIKRRRDRNMVRSGQLSGFVARMLMRGNSPTGDNPRAATLGYRLFFFHPSCCKNVNLTATRHASTYNTP